MRLDGAMIIENMAASVMEVKTPKTEGTLPGFHRSTKVERQPLPGFRTITSPKMGRPHDADILEHKQNLTRGIDDDMRAGGPGSGRRPGMGMSNKEIQKHLRSMKESPDKHLAHMAEYLHKKTGPIKIFDKSRWTDNDHELFGKLYDAHYKK